MCVVRMVASCHLSFSHADQQEDLVHCCFSPKCSPHPWLMFLFIFPPTAGQLSWLFPGEGLRVVRVMLC